MIYYFITEKKASAREIKVTEMERSPVPMNSKKTLNQVNHLVVSWKNLGFLPTKYFRVPKILVWVWKIQS